MNQLPPDLQKIIIGHCSYDQIGELQNLCTLDSIFYLRHLDYIIGLDYNLVRELWNLPYSFGSLTPYQNYVRVLSYFGYIIPETSQFLSFQTCYKLSLERSNHKMIHHFANLLKIKSSTVRNNIRDSFCPIADLIRGKCEYIELQIVKEGQIPEISKNILSIYKGNLFFDLVVVAVIYNHHSILDQLIEKFDLKSTDLETARFIAYSATNNIEQLNKLYPQRLSGIIELTINWCIKEIVKINSQVKKSTVQWIASKILNLDGLIVFGLADINNLLLVEVLAILYNSKKDQIKDMEVYFYHSKTKYPLSLYIMGKILPEETLQEIEDMVGKVLGVKKIDKLCDLESLNIFTLLYPNHQLSEKIIQKFKYL